MEYLKNFLTLEEYEQFVSQLTDEDVSLFLTHEENVLLVLKYFKSLELNLFDLLLYKYPIVFDRLDSIKEKVESHPSIIPLLKEDVSNFDLIGL